MRWRSFGSGLRVGRAWGDDERSVHPGGGRSPARASESPPSALDRSSTPGEPQNENLIVAANVIDAIDVRGALDVPASTSDRDSSDVRPR